MLNGLLKPAWQNKSAEKRRLAVLKLSSEKPSNQVIFEQLALSDPSHSIRQICFEKIHKVETLFAVYLKQDAPTSRQAAKLALSALFGANSALSAEQLDVFVAHVRSNYPLTDQQECFELLAQHARFKELREQLIANFSDEQKASIIAGVHYADTRAFIAEKLTHIEALELARRELKGKDKRAEKTIRLSLEKYRQEQKLHESVNQDAQVLCEQLEFIAEHPQWRNEFKTKYQTYISKWQGLELTPPEHYAQRFEAAKKLAEAQVNIQLENEQRESGQEQVAKNLSRYCASLCSLELRDLLQERLSINTVLSEALAVWLQLNAAETAREGVAVLFTSCQQALSSLASLLESIEQEDYQQADQRLRKFNWPNTLPELNALPAAKKHIDDQKLDFEAAKKDYKKTLDALHKRINRLLGTSNKGDLKKARHELSATTKAASQYSGRDGKLLSERLEAATELVAKMNDCTGAALRKPPTKPMSLVPYFLKRGKPRRKQT